MNEKKLFKKIINTSNDVECFFIQGRISSEISFSIE